MRTLTISILLAFVCMACKSQVSEYLIAPPEKGFVTKLKATKWEESLLTGNGTIGALVIGDVVNERLILSHEKLFMPQYPPYEAPDLGSRLTEMRSLILAGRNEDAVELMIEAGQEVGIDDMIWTNPLVPAGQLEIEFPSQEVSDYARGVNYETGEASVSWKSQLGEFRRDVFTSRPDNVIVTRISSPSNSKINVKLNLNQLPVDGGDNDEEQEFAFDDVVESLTTQVVGSQIQLKTLFKRKWEGSLKGYVLETRVLPQGGELIAENNGLEVKDADEIVLHSRIVLSYELPVKEETGLEILSSKSYDELLKDHYEVHGEMFNRFTLDLTPEPEEYLPPEQLQSSSSVGNLNPALVEQLLDAARYELISSTGEIPPTLQGIWGGTWLPAWSGDFTLNGNVPTAIAGGLNTNFQEVTESYMNYMYSMFDEFKANASGLYGAPGIFVPSRSSSSGSTYHFGDYYPHLFWFAGNSWTSQFFYDYWMYTGDEDFLKEKTIPFMLASMDFYEHILYKSDNGEYMFIPSYSPELGPRDTHPLAINATMDVAGLKQLIRNLLTLTDQGLLETGKVEKWKEILDNLPAYAIDEKGDLKEWIWDGYENDNAHRHVSHLYPLFYEVDLEFSNSEDLMNAAKTAIEERLAYRRPRQGAEMAFGLVQIGIAAAHIGEINAAYECLDYLCHTYWSPAYTSYHDPMEIFNMDISGGLPALVAEMLVMSSSDEVVLLPALPDQWKQGSVDGILTRSGVTIGLTWEDSQVQSVRLFASRDTRFTLKNGTGDDQEVSLKAGESLEL